MIVGITSPLWILIVVHHKNKYLFQRSYLYFLMCLRSAILDFDISLCLQKVGPGEVDDELEEEVGSECGKYGTVTRVLIFEITEANFPTHEAVRIFVQFSRSEETTKALVDLDGRFFGGRTVRATFYDEVKFSKNELAPVPGEIPGY